MEKGIIEIQHGRSHFMRHSDETEHKHLCFGAQVTKNTTHGPCRERGKRAHSVGKLEFSPAAAATLGRDPRSTFFFFLILFIYLFFFLNIFI